MSRRISWVSAGVAGLLAVGAVTAASAMAGQPPVAAPHWHIIKSVKTDFNGDFTAVAPTGLTTGWAFDGLGFTSAPTAWERNGSTWTKMPFPSTANEQVFTAGASSPSNVWAFLDTMGGGSTAVRWNGSKWSVMKSFPDLIGGASVLAPNDIWVFGELPVPHVTTALGVWHYNGSKWTQVGKDIAGGSVLSATDVWGFAAASVEHWNGHTWTAASVKKLLPPVIPGPLNDPQIMGILALSDSNVYAVANGNDEDDGGPVVVLRYNGVRWSRVSGLGDFGNGPGSQFSYDGSGGLWLPMTGGDGATSFLLHFTGGKLVKTTLPVSAPTIEIGAVARIPGTHDQLAGGLTHAAGNPGSKVVAVLLQYS